MAPRGRRPKPPHLRIVDGTHRPDRHGDVAETKSAIKASQSSFGPMVLPRYLKGHALAAWKRYIEPAYWLDASREPAAIIFCQLYGEFRDAPERFPAAKHSQMRAFMADIGLTDARNRPAAPQQRDEMLDW